MALSLSNFLVTLLLLLPFGLIGAETHHYDWNVEWVRRNPDGMAGRPVISINGQWPLPLINVTKGDRVVVNLHNQLGNESTSMHWHGLFQNGTNDMDGPVGVTQCDIPPGQSMTYDFIVDQPGTYWYHSHTKGQYPDGWRGQFVVHDPENPYRGQFDEEVAITLSDWYHEEMPKMLGFFISYKNPTGAEPIPASALMNDTQNMTVSFEPGKTYFFRMSNIGAFAGQYFWIEGHDMTIIEVDGVYTKPAKAQMIYITAAQRYGFLVTARNDSSANFAMVGSMDESLFDTVPDTLNPNVTGWIMYDNNKPKPKPAILDEFTPFDDYTLSAQDGMELLKEPDFSFHLDLAFNDLGDGANYGFLNAYTYTTPVVPTLYSVLTTGADATNATVYGQYTNPFVLKKGDVIELILNNNDGGKHPFHLHGHNFQAVYRSPPNAGFYDSSQQHTFPAVPMRRDTFMVRPMGNYVIRYVADNPGVWLFHCHLDWHLASGLAVTTVEAPLELQKTLKVPSNHYDVCKAGNNPYRGNAAANTEDFLDLKGQNESVRPLPSGFTAKGIVALVFSCISAFIGMAVISWYGAAPLGSAELAAAQRFVARAEGGTE